MLDFTDISLSQLFYNSHPHICGLDGSVGTSVD